MVSHSRKTCYKCGNIGHLADDCQSAERLCYNCKSQGHESANCPFPRTKTTKQCYNCHQFGHVRSECPLGARRAQAAQNSEYSMTPVIENSLYPANLGFSMPSLAPPPPSDVNFGLSVPQKEFYSHFSENNQGCYVRGQYDHIVSQCPRMLLPTTFGKPVGGGQPVQSISICYRCGDPSHLAKDCLHEGNRCYTCGVAGHLSRQCPNDQNNKSCYKCGQQGHISRDCPLSTVL